MTGADLAVWIPLLGWITLLMVRHEVVVPDADELVEVHGWDNIVLEAMATAVWI